MALRTPLSVIPGAATMAISSMLSNCLKAVRPISPSDFCRTTWHRVPPLLKMLRDQRRNRLPVLNADGSLLFVIHLSSLTDYISTKALAGGGSKPVADLTISDLQTDDAQLYQQILGWACVKLGATLAEAKSAMEDIPGCSDVFVTTAGRKSDPAVGWLTNVEIGLRSSA